MPKFLNPITITTPSGSAPLVVNSSTVVSNLNADLLDGQHGTYYQNASNLNAGTVPAAQMPAFTGGDVTSTAGSVALSLPSVGTAGTYRSVTTDAKGRVTAGTNPTTLAGYGITDALPLAGGTLTGGLIGTSANFSGTFIQTGEALAVDACAIVHNTNVESYYQLSRRLQAFSHLGSTTTLEIEAVTLGGGNYNGEAQRTTWRISSRGALYVTRHDEHGGVGKVSLKILNDTAVPDANGQDAKYVVGLVCGNTTDFVMVWMRARFLQDSGTSRWVTIARLATAAPSTVSGSAMTYSSGWIANTGFTNTSFTEVVPAGKFAALALTGVLTSTVATGTAPLVVASATAVANLNSDLLDGQHGAYYQDAGNLNAGTLLAARLPAFTGGDVTSSAGSVALTLANSGVTAGTYTKVTVDAKGRVTTGALLASADLPTYTGTITSSQVTTALGFTPYNATNPSGYITNTATITGYSGGISVSDSRAVVTTPQSINIGVVFDFKQNTTEGLSDGGTYFGEMTFRQYGSTTDWSGGLSHQLGFTDNGNVWQRSGSSTTWGAWKKLLDATNFSSHALPLSGGTLTGQLISNSKIETTGVVTGSSFSGAGTGLTGTAASLTAGAVPWTGVTGKPTTLAGYGITDALPLTGGTLTGGLSGTTGSFSGEVTWSGWNSGNARAVRIGYSGGNYGGIGYGINYTATTGSHTYSIADAVTRIDLADGIQVYSAATGTVGAAVSWTTLLEATRGNGNLRWKGNTVLDSNNYSSFALPLSGGTMTGNIILPATGYVGLNGGSTFGIGTLATNRNSGVFDTVESTGTDPLELNYYQGGAVKIGSGTYGSKSLYAAGIFDGGNQVLHAGNYTSYILPSYSPTRYLISETGATTQFAYLGRWSSVSQNGQKLKMTVLSAAGYNATASQNQRTELYFKTSNGSSSQTGSTGVYYADGFAYRIGQQNSAPTYFRIVSVDSATFDIYGYFNNFTGASFYEVTVSGGTWTNSGTLATPSGNYIDITPDVLLHSGNYNSYAPTLTGTGASGTWGISISGSAAQLNGQAASYYLNASNLNAGTVPAAQMPAHTGDVTSTAGTVALTIANDTVTNAKLKTMGAGTIKGNNGGVANTPSDLTAAQVATMLSGQTMNIAGSSTSCTGNAATATNVAWSGITSKPTTVSGYGITDTIPSLAAVAEADLNTATATGFRLISKTGYSSTLLTINVAGSSGPVQIDANYTGVLRWRNQTDSTTWTAWKTLLHDGNYGGYSTFTGTVTGTNFSGPGTGLTGTAASLTAGSANAIADGTVSTSAKIAASVVTYAKIQNVSVSTVLGNSSASVAQAPVEISMASLAGMLSNQTMNINGSSASCTGNAATATNGFTVKPVWAGAQNLIADLANFNNSVPSGFYQYSGATNSPTATWYNLINVRHSNTGNDHGFQLAMSYYDEVLWSRTYSGGTGANNGTFTTWRAHLHSGNYSSYALPLTGGTVSGQLVVSATTDPAILLNGGASADTSTHLYTAIGGVGKVRIQRNGIIAALGLSIKSGADVNGATEVFSVSNAGAVVGASFSGAGTGLTGTAASLTAGAVAWTGVTGKPTTISGYGITDIVSSNSGSPVAADTTTKNGFYYVNSNISLFSQTDGALFVQAYDNTWASQIYQDYRTGQLAIRGRNSGTWQAWRTVLDSVNYSSYALPLAGGTLTGALNSNSKIETTGNVIGGNFSGPGTGLTGTAASLSIGGNAATATSSPLLSALSNYVWSASTLPQGYNQGIQASFVSASQGFQNYGSLVTVNTYSAGGGALQLYVPYSPTYGGTGLQVRFGNYDVSSGNSWTSWKTLLASDNYTSYTLPLTGGTLTGALTATSFSGAGTGLTGTAASLSIGGSAGSVAWTGVTGKPTTLSGYGITDALDTSATAQTKAGNLTISGVTTTKSAGTTTGTPLLRFAQTIGDAYATSFTITHNLGTQDVHVQIRRMSDGSIGNFASSILASTANSVTVTFASAPTASQYRVIIFG